MSFISKLFGRKSKPVVTAAPTPPPPPPKAPKPDRSGEIAAEEARLNEVLAAHDEVTIGEIVVSGISTKIRQRAADAITSPDRIRELIRLSRGKDNAVYKILTAKRDALLEVERAAAALQAELDAVAAGIARHARLPFDAIFEATLIEQERRWQSLAAQAPEAMKHSVEQDFAKARAVVASHQAAIAAEQARREAAAHAAREALAASEQAHLEATQSATERSERLAAERAEQDAKAQSESEVVRELISLLRQMQTALDRGGSARAARLRAALATKLTEAAETPLPTWFQRQLTLADEQLEKLKDWLAFTVGPKRLELIDRMQSLVGAEIAPEQLAMHIRKLQDEWRTLHRGAGDDEPAEEEKFKELANRAYEPCKVHFAAKAAQRAENREKREAMLMRLAEFATTLDAEAPNWRRVIPTLIEARREWRQYAPVDQEIAEALQAQFKAAMDGISAKFEAECARNVEAKRALIESAAALLQVSDVREAIDGAKSLQRAWKTIGIVPREQDNPLWEEFRGHCNAVFERSAAEAAAFEAALSAAATRAGEIIAEIERVAELTAADLREGLKSLEALQAEFETLDFPRAQARDLYQRLQRGLDRTQEAQHRDRAQAVTRAWADLFETAAAIRRYDWTRRQESNDETLSPLKEAVSERLATLGAAPKYARSALERLWQAVGSASADSDPTANEVSLRMICIRAELATDIATPEADQERRREYQMQRLLQSRNLGADVEPLNFEDLALEWFAVGAIDPAAEEALRQRFERCREATTLRARSRD